MVSGLNRFLVPFDNFCHLSLVMRKPTFSKADQRLCFCYMDSTISLPSSKFPASSNLLCLYRSVCVRPVRKPHCWFSCALAHVFVGVEA